MTTRGGDTVITGWRHQLWLAFLIASSIAFSVVFACAAQLAAFGTAGALTLSRRDALLVTIGVWLANQLAGYVLLGYPWTMNSLAWAFVIGAAAVLCTMAARWAALRLSAAWAVARALAAFVAAFVAAFAVYEAALFAVAITLLGGTDTFAPSIVGQILVTNVAALVGLYGLNRLAEVVGLRRRPAIPVSAAVRSA